MNRNYKCQRCGTKFSEPVSKRFIKTVLPKCPACGSDEIGSVDYIKAIAPKEKK